MSVGQPESIELSIVMPCLNEADTVAGCVRKAFTALRDLNVHGEVIVADNGSCDGSQPAAESEGARVVSVSERGYGAALMGGIAAARGRFVIMGDADDSYDFTKIDVFYERLKSGADLVQGCRLPRGGGTILPGAMPSLHRWLGNPVLTKLVRTMFRTQLDDVYCGLRGFRKDWQQSLQQRCTGMEFATEMIVKSSLFGGRVEQVPITLHPDGRVAHRSHLRTFRDGWRTLRFFLLLCPRWTFLIPGSVLAILGFTMCALALPRVSVGGVTFDVHTLLVGVLSILVATQMMWCGLIAHTVAIAAGILPPHPQVQSLSRIMTLERLLLVSLVMALAGVAMIGATAWGWAASGFGPLEYARTMRVVVPGVGLIAIACQCAASSFLLSVLRMARP